MGCEQHDSWHASEIGVRDPFGPGVDSFNRIHVVMGNFGQMPRDAWFVQLGDAWSICDNIASWRTNLRWILSTATRAELDLMMNQAERDALAQLPERVAIWRGCFPVNRPGLSWTLHRDIAARFVTLSRYRRPGAVPLLRSGTTRRVHAVLKLDRKEFEVITPRVFAISEEALH